EGADRDREQLRELHVGRGLDLRDIGRKQRRDRDLGREHLGGGLDAEQLGRARIDEEHGEQDSPEGYEWHCRPLGSFKARKSNGAIMEVPSALFNDRTRPPWGEPGLQVSAVM